MDSLSHSTPGALGRKCLLDIIMKGAKIGSSFLNQLVIAHYFHSGHLLSLSAPSQGDANRSYSDDDRSSCNFDENDRPKESLHLSGMTAFRILQDVTTYR